MKNNKRSPLTIARQAAFIAEMGGEYPTQMSSEFNELKKEFIGIDTDDMKQSRIAMESTAQGYRENCPELYGRSTTPMFPNGLPVLHTRGADCDVETHGETVFCSIPNEGEKLGLLV